MCATCGCDAHGHDGRGHDHPPPSRSISALGEVRIQPIEQRVLARNDHLAGHNRRWFADRRIAVVNLLSSPGAGKTTLLETTIRLLAGAVEVCVIEGDQATDEDARRIRATGRPVVQVNTGTGCHLDATMVAKAIRELEPSPGSLLFIENVGNLVCPALFDLGERKKVLIASVTEGEDKPLKYPHMFRAADLVLLNKIDLLPHVRFDVATFRAHVERTQPRAKVLLVSALRGDHMADFCAWLRSEGCDDLE